MGKGGQPKASEGKRGQARANEGKRGQARASVGNRGQARVSENKQDSVCRIRNDATEGSRILIKSI